MCLAHDAELWQLNTRWLLFYPKYKLEFLFTLLHLTVNHRVVI